MTGTRRANPGAWFLLAGLAILATGRALGNGFAFDDVPIIVENSQVHTLSPPWVYAQQSYWPPNDLGDAYRPWTVWWLAIQWSLGDGAPWIFHLGNLLLTVGLTLLVYRLLRALVTDAGAIAGAALFAVHPVHVEATANVVGQGELWMTLFVVAAALWYLEARRRGRLGPGERLGLAGLMVLAAAAKEQGIVLPGLLAAIEWCLPSSTPWRERIRQLAPLYLLLAATAIGFLATRYAVLGDAGGGPPAAGLEGLDLLGRARVMAPMVATWVRLLVWPRDLLAQYSPPAFGAATPFGLAHVAAAFTVIVAMVALWFRRRAPLAALSALWIAIAVLPVANVLVPTGLLVAERTLLLPSVAVAILGGAIVSWAAPRPRLGFAAAAVVVALVIAGSLRTWSRQSVWRDNPTLFAQTVIDNPRSYRGFFVFAKELLRRSDPAGARAMYRRAAELYQGDHRVYEEWGQLERSSGRCDLAIAIFQAGITRHPRATVLRSRLFECLLTTGAVDLAIGVAQQGLDLGMTEFTEPLARATKARVAPPVPPPATR